MQLLILHNFTHPNRNILWQFTKWIFLDIYSSRLTINAECTAGHSKNIISRRCLRNRAPLLRLKHPNSYCWEALKKWTERQIDLFAKKGLTLQQLRIKNPGQAFTAWLVCRFAHGCALLRCIMLRTYSFFRRLFCSTPCLCVCGDMWGPDMVAILQGLDWTADAVWAHVDTIIKVFKEKGLPAPIVYIHNHVTWPISILWSLNKRQWSHPMHCQCTQTWSINCFEWWSLDFMLSMKRMIEMVSSNVHWLDKTGKTNPLTRMPRKGETTCWPKSPWPSLKRCYRTDLLLPSWARFCFDGSKLDDVSRDLFTLLDSMLGLQRYGWPHRSWALPQSPTGKDDSLCALSISYKSHTAHT